MYMITGIKIARGASVESSKPREVGGSGKVGVDLTAVGAPVTLGLEGGIEKKRERSVAYAGSTDYIFAYQLKRVRARKGGNFKEDDYSKGALFGMDDEDEKEMTLREAYEIEDFDGEGEGIPDVSKQVAIDDEIGPVTT